MHTSMLKQLLISHESDGIEVDCSVETQRATQRPWSCAVIDAKTSVHLQLASVIFRDDAKLVNIFWMACHEQGNSVVGMLFEDERFLHLGMNSYSIWHLAVKFDEKRENTWQLTDKICLRYYMVVDKEKGLLALGCKRILGGKMYGDGATTCLTSHGLLKMHLCSMMCHCDLCGFQGFRRIWVGFLQTRVRCVASVPGFCSGFNLHCYGSLSIEHIHTFAYQSRWQITKWADPPTIKLQLELPSWVGPSFRVLQLLLIDPEGT